MKLNELVNALRTTDSRSKRALLDDAADTIENLMAVSWNCREVCETCKNRKPISYCQDDDSCINCKKDCCCKDCGMGNYEADENAIVKSR